MVVALDGPAGVGKSTIAKLISKRNGLFYLNSGNFYRAVTYSLLSSNLDPKSDDDIISVAKNIDIKIVDSHLYLSNRIIDDYLHTDSVDKYVAQHSAIIDVRMEVNKRIQEICKDLDLVCEGRDMTTVVFPNAKYKFYMDASVAVRAKRRFDQGSSNLSLEEIEQSIEQRDYIDKNKKVGSLKISDDAIYIDTSDLTIEEVCEKVESIILTEKE